MPRGFGGENEAGRANDPSGGSFGGGRSEDRDAAQADRDRAADNQRERDAVQAAIDKARSTGKTVRTIENLGDGRFSDTDQFGNTTIVGPEQRGILSLIGYDPNKPLTENIYDMVVPGQNTPLGALSAVPGLLGASQTVQGIVGLANAIAGKIGQSEAQSKSAISDSVVGKDSIVGNLGTPNTGIASGMPDTGYKGDFQ
jgi:hypothetical protein